MKTKHHSNNTIPVIESNTEMLIDLIKKIVSKIHKDLGPGFRESVYQEALNIIFKEFNLNASKEYSYDIMYLGQVAGCGRLDFFINDPKFFNFVIELKSVESINDNHRSQLGSYLLSFENSTDEELKNTTFGILINWPGAYLNDEQSKHTELKSLEPEIEFYVREGQKITKREVFI